MRVVEAAQFGDADVLEVVERPVPVAAAGQVAVRVLAATVNPADWLTRAGVLAGMMQHLPAPYVLGWDFSGTVETAAPGFPAGTRVAGMVPWFTTGAGTYAEVLLVDPSWIAVVPDGLDLVTAAAVPLNSLTAKQALDLLGLHAGETLLVTGASGAVGGAAVQLAAGAGIEVIAVASSDDEDHVDSLGAKHVLGRQETDALIARVRELVPGGVDAVLDAVPVGPPLIAAVRDGGRFVTVLDVALPAPERGITPAKVSAVPDGRALSGLLADAAEGRLTVRVLETLPLEQAPEAHRRASVGGVRGKILLTL